MAGVLAEIGFELGVVHVGDLHHAVPDRTYKLYYQLTKYYVNEIYNITVRKYVQ
jgi:hypothetical protein